jgi:hypothetical protein
MGTGAGCTKDRDEMKRGIQQIAIFCPVYKIYCIFAPIFKRPLNMAENLVIVESPAKAKTIEKFSGKRLHSQI